MPAFSPEIFRTGEYGPRKVQAACQGIEQLTDEEWPSSSPSSRKRRIVGPWGELQFDVIQYLLTRD